ncbi:MAG: hypothetical protein NC123_13425 [Butyrivibrio sp.]|nr:hypothetical protein [Acetatifactor muris]MCM1560522.1 hypothetical protein [Butyrivibrio sp.]
MKFVKGISLFFIYPMFMLVLGFYAGVRFTDYYGQFRYQSEEDRDVLEPEESMQEQPAAESAEPVGNSLDFERAEELSEEADFYVEAASASETLNVETKYVLEERDIYRDTVVETTWRLPDKYVGMNREQFLEAMEEYEAFPPLSEMQRGFVSLDVLSFSRERVVVQMNYRVVLPTDSFYLAVYDNKVVVLLEDRETVYIETDIKLEKLPEEEQEQIINMMFIEDEAGLYDFLEAHSS